MSDSDNVAVVRRLFDEVVNGGHYDRLDEIVGSKYVDHTLARPGARSLRLSIAALRRAFPDLQVTVADIFGDQDRVAVRLRFRGTHQAPLLGIPPSGKVTEWSGNDIYRVVDGKIVEAWTERDRSTLVAQIAPTRTKRVLSDTLRDPLATTRYLYGYLAPLTTSWRERASLLRFLGACLLPRFIAPREAMLHLQDTHYTLGLGSAEVYALKEVYHDRCYERMPDFIPQSGWVAIDVGANIGAFTVQQAKRGARVLAFEPNADCYRRLSANVAQNGVSARVQLFNYAVGSAPGTATMHVPFGLTTHGSVRADSASDGAASGKVTITSLDDILTGLGVTRIDLLKIDVEGAEIEVLHGAARTLQGVERIILEYHSPELRDEATSILTGGGFSRVLQLETETSGRAGLLYLRKE